jgi:hypothetical protein
METAAAMAGVDRILFIFLFSLKVLAEPYGLKHIYFNHMFFSAISFYLSKTIT